MKVAQTYFSDVLVITPDIHSDQRGFFMESYNCATFLKHGMNYRFVQDNHSLSTDKGTIRGLHYQLSPKAQAKLVRVLAGAVYDVVVDIRPDSAAFGHWMGIELDSRHHHQLLIPAGYAHGFCTLEINTEVLYKVDEHYSPEHERGIIWNDPVLSISWPVENPVLSEKDKKHPLLASAEFSIEKNRLF